MGQKTSMHLGYIEYSDPELHETVSYRPLCVQLPPLARVRGRLPVHNVAEQLPILIVSVIFCRRQQIPQGFLDQSGILELLLQRR